MSTVLEIESAIEKLPSSECNTLLIWFQQYMTTSAVSASNVTHDYPPKKLSGFEILGDLVGSIKNAPSDLSSNPKYLAGYGKENI
jgi:hypothetical protein